jgi:DNA-binding MarR family transcriptional regulator
MTAGTVSTEQALQAVVAMHRLLRGLRRTGGGAVPPTQLIVLALINQHGPLRVGELAARVPCSQPTVTAVVATMQSDGLVSRRRDPTDGRGTQVLATEHGRTTLRSVALGEAHALAALLATLEPDRRSAFLAAAPVLAELADRPVPGLPVPGGDVAR